MKRVIALPGESIAVHGTEVFLNGRKLEQQAVVARAEASAAEDEGQLVDESDGQISYRILLRPADEPVADYAQTEVPEGHCFVLGDDRNHSRDSRQFGFVPLGDILGKAQYIYYPAQRWSRFGAIGP